MFLVGKMRHFPRLYHPSLKYCYKLNEIPSRIGDIPTLQVIKLFECPSAVTSIALIQEGQLSLGNDNFQVSSEEEFDQDCHASLRKVIFSLGIKCLSPLLI